MSTFKVQWYPGHMEKARRSLSNVLKHAAFVVEVADARAPVSTRNPELTNLLRNRPRLLLLAKADLAEPGATNSWIEHLSLEGEFVLALSLIDSRSPRLIRNAIRRMVGASPPGPAERLRSIPGLSLPKSARTRARGVIVGVPNTGKSTVIRALGGRAEKADRPGVTRGIQEFSVTGDITLYDSPGMMWPRALEGDAALRLVWLGCIGPAAYDPHEAGRELVCHLRASHRGLLTKRYGLSGEAATDPDDILKEIAVRRGLLRGGEGDLEKAAAVLLSEFRSGLLGPITLELPDEHGKEEPD